MAFGFVLVGGRSSRMGRDKARLPYRGLPMALYQAEKLAFVCGRAALVGKDRKQAPGSPYAFVEDGAEPTASAYGVLAALAYSPDDTNVILATDLPRVSETFLAALLDVAEAIPAPAVVPVSGGVPQTLCAVWRRSALLPLTARVASGELSLQRAIEAIGGVVIPEAETASLPGGEADAFFNVNTPEDYHEIEDETAPFASRR